MINNFLNILLLLSILFQFPSIAQDKDNEANKIYPIQREFRAAWVATVANINWPSKPGLSEEKQKEEAIYLLDLLKENNYNAVIFQVRPQADALYESDLEPWSYYLTGEQGYAPDDFYDPLKFWIEEAHNRCLELHAWINPYRAHHKVGGIVSEHSIVKAKPDLVVKLEEGYWWFDPSLEETQDHLYTVVMDIARRYDIDGIHFDDYFYPYPSYNNNKDFPDSVSWNNYVNDGGTLTRGDWRRQHVNKSIERIYENLKLMRPHIKFGLSPFGIWRPNNPNSIKGFDQYDNLYADAKLWLNKGWLDYWSPQLYWRISKIEQSFPVLLGWWNKENYQNRYIWPGISIFNGPEETTNQIMVTRGMIPENPGNIHWSIAPLVSDTTFAEALVTGVYKKKALVPPLTWLSRDLPKMPKAQLSQNESNYELQLKLDDKRGIRFWIIYYTYGDKNRYEIKSIDDTLFKFPIISQSQSIKVGNAKELNSLGISVVNKFGNESKIVNIPLN